MKTQFHTLPDWDFIGGETQKRTLVLYKGNGSKYDIPGASAHFAIAEFVNADSNPRVAKDLPISEDADGACCVVTILLSPTETVNLAGKYLYQITIKDASGNTSIPQKGIMHIGCNIDKSFIG